MFIIRRLYDTQSPEIRVMEIVGMQPFSTGGVCKKCWMYSRLVFLQMPRFFKLGNAVLTHLWLASYCLYHHTSGRPFMVLVYIHASTHICNLWCMY